MNLPNLELMSSRFSDNSASTHGDTNERRLPIIDRPTVFVVDNDSSVRGRLELLIESHGYRVESFATAEDFLQGEMNAEAACLVLDVGLPGLDGLGLQNLLLRRGVLLPIVFTTAHADIQTAVRALQSGAISFLLKPVHESTLIAEIKKAFAVWHDEYRQHSEIEEIQRRYYSLTRREREVFSIIVNGKLKHQSIEARVDVHRDRVLEKMRAQSEAELALMGQKLCNLSSNRNCNSLSEGHVAPRGRYWDSYCT